MTAKHSGVEAFPLHWPTGWPRTQTPTLARFVADFAPARDGLFREISLLGGSHVTLSTNVPLRRDGLPYVPARQPDDRGVAVYFLRRGKPMVFACDRWNRVEDNLRAIAKTIEAIRGLDRWGASEMMERAVQAFEALPPPPSCWTILGVRPHATRDEINAAYRSKAVKAHPDHGGSHAAMAELNTARDEAMEQATQ